MTIKSLAKLSVFALLINHIGKAEADSFSLAVRGTACADVSAEQTRSEIRYRAYDKAVLLAVKNSPYVRQEAASMDDYGYNVLAYRLADKALNDITVITVRDDNEKSAWKSAENWIKRKQTPSLGQSSRNLTRQMLPKSPRK